MSDRLRRSLDTLRWLGAGAVVLPLVSVWLFGRAVRVALAHPRSAFRSEGRHS